ncbi:piggyBac transposable element-derived protein 4-like [Palaemon carinicauda]|uniref:piggyBac transposable element-derived protein 4-like n=1 Tax=Palaemon carinicauda TaxID=392227 RepID=UPI0035B5B7C6
METNRYAAYMIEKMQPLAPRSRYRAWRDVDAGEIKAFIAIEIAMGLVHTSSLASYFSKKFWLTETPGFSNIMSRDRYEIIRSCLDFADNSVDGNDDRLYKIKPILDIVKDLYSKYYVSGRDLSVDESIVKFKGRLFFKQYMPKKPTKWGIKVWSLCDSKTGYLLKFDVYTGKGLDSNKGKGLGASVVENLFEGFENKGHVVYMDSFFSGVPLFQKLRSKGTGACGTVRPNRKYLPSQMKKVKPKKGQLPIMWKSKDEELVAVVWQDSGRVNILSSVGDTGTVKKSIQSKKGVREVDKPSLQAQYNKYMGGVDLFDQFCSTYPFNHRSKKWYQTLWHFVIEVALVNSKISYNLQNRKKLTQVVFRQEVIKGLLEGYNTKPRRNNVVRDLVENKRLGERHFIAQYENKKYLPNCSVCSILPSQCCKKGKGTCKVSCVLCHPTILILTLWSAGQKAFFGCDNIRKTAHEVNKVSLSRQSPVQHHAEEVVLLPFGSLIPLLISVRCLVPFVIRRYCFLRCDFKTVRLTEYNSLDFIRGKEVAKPIELFLIRYDDSPPSEFES